MRHVCEAPGTGPDMHTCSVHVGHWYYYLQDFSEPILVEKEPIALRLPVPPPPPKLLGKKQFKTTLIMYPTQAPSTSVLVDSYQHWGTEKRAQGLVSESWPWVTLAWGKLFHLFIKWKMGVI